jgi:hypothetical protein
MAPFPRTLKELCTPAALYFIISIIALLIVLFQNLGNTHSYNVGNFSCRVPNTFLIFIVKFIYIVFWTYVLNLICKDGHRELSWILLFLPFFVFMLMVIFFMLLQL